MLGGWILWLSKDLTHPKDELKSFIEAHGGSVATRLSQKVFIHVNHPAISFLTLFSMKLHLVMRGVTRETDWNILTN